MVRTKGFDDYLRDLKNKYGAKGHQIDYYHSNHCGELIDKIQEADGNYDGIVLNPGGYSHSSIALGDAVKSVTVPVVEVHVSNIFARESFRHHSYVSAGARAVISGAGIAGYQLALEVFIQ